MFVAGEVDLRILALPEGFDPCDFLVRYGAEEFQLRLEGAVDAFEHAFRVHTADVNLFQDTHRANQALENLLAVVAKAPRLTGDTTAAKVLRERQVIARLAREFRIDESVLRSRISELRRSAPRHRDQGLSVAVTPRLTVRDLDPYEAELLEILATHPELADMALEEVATEALVSQPAREIYEIYRVVTEKGEAADFTRILAELEDPQLKNLLVVLDEQARQKEHHTQHDAVTRLRHLTDDLRYHADKSRRSDSITALEQGKLDDQEELDLLEQLVEQERKRQGISAPTDG